MKKNNLKRLEAYKRRILDSLQSDVPGKHKDSPGTYKAFLNRELKMVESSIEKEKGI